MKISVPALSVDIFTPVLSSLSAILEKGTALATAKKFDSSVLVTSRLAPDMLPLARQVQIACDTAKKGAARLAGLEAPTFEDNEKTIEELRTRIARTIDYLKSIPVSAFEGAEERDIKDMDDMIAMLDSTQTPPQQANPDGSATSDEMMKTLFDDNNGQDDDNWLQKL